MSDIKAKANNSLKQQNISIYKHQLYQKSPINVEQVVFEPTNSPISRRGFLSGLATMTTLIASEIVFARFMPAGFIPLAFAQTSTPFVSPGKNTELVVLNDRPINAETPAHCAACHSAKLVTQNRMTRENWLATGCKNFKVCGCLKPKKKKS